MDNHLPETLYIHIATIAPSLTHLCLPSRLSVDLRDALSDNDEERTLPLTLRRICILLDVYHRCTWGSNQSHCHRCQLMMLAATDHRIVLLNDPGEGNKGHKAVRR